MSDEAEVEDGDVQVSDGENDDVYWQRYYRLQDGGFPADVALSLAAIKRIDTVGAVGLLEKCGDPELTARILV